MTANIYDQHRAAFANVSAYVVMHRGERVATVAFKYPRDGAGRLYAYVHWMGTPMVRGFAGGGGYDKHTAACVSAIRRMPTDADIGGRRDTSLAEMIAYRRFTAAMSADNGEGWDNHLHRAGFDVVQAV